MMVANRRSSNIDGLLGVCIDLVIPLQPNTLGESGNLFSVKNNWHGDFILVTRDCMRLIKNVAIMTASLQEELGHIHGEHQCSGHLQNRRFTWSNERQNPTLYKLDSMFCIDEWNIYLGTHVLHALSSSLSDHCPLVLADDCGPWRPRTFKSENFWVSIPSFQDVVREAWQQDSGHHEPCQNLFHKLRKTGAHLSNWSRALFSQAKIHLHAALMIILRLDSAHGTRALSAGELLLRSGLKRRVIGLAVIERTRKKTMLQDQEFKGRWRQYEVFPSKGKCA